MKTQIIKLIGLFSFLFFLGVQPISSQKAKYKTWIETYPKLSDTLQSYIDEALINSTTRGVVPVAYQQLYLNTETKGLLYSLNDSTINFPSSINAFNNGFPNEIHINDIKAIKYRKKGKAALWGIIGGVSGLFIGGAIGSASVDDKCDSFGGCLDNLGDGIAKTFGGMMIGGLIGTGIGIAIGSAKVKIPINGSQTEYEKQKEKLSKFQSK